MIAQLSEVIHVHAMSGVEAVVRGRLGNRVRDFRLLFLGDGVVLLGFAATYHVKQLAQHAVMQATRIPILANEIEVEILVLA
jgi:hypothetical protein